MDVEGDTGSCMAPVSQGDGTDEKTIDSRAFSRSLVAEVILGMSWLLVDVFDARLLVKKISGQATSYQPSAAKLLAGSVFNWSWPARVDELGQATGSDVFAAYQFPSNSKTKNAKVLLTATI